ncbi:hypothetical protein J7J12_01720 [bacterium]|nr:hypothetical protein [bacterium]
MPTQFTEDLYEKEVTFEEFVLKCARAMTELSLIRDQLPDAPIPEEFQPSDYHLKKLEKARQRLAEIQSWDDEQAEQEAEKAYQEAVRRRNEIIARNTQIRQRYERMLAQVQAWIPPTPDHEKLKQFMIDQLKISIKSDCSYVPNKPRRVSGAEFKQQQMTEVWNNIKYNEKEYEKEVKSVQESNNWLRVLRKSLHLPLSI